MENPKLKINNSLILDHWSLKITLFMYYLKIKNWKLKIIPHSAVKNSLKIGHWPLIIFIFCFFTIYPITTFASTLNRAPNNLGLVGYWPMDEGVGNQAGDFSGQRNNGTITGATWTNGKHGKALEFNHSSGYATAANTASLRPTNVTVSAWVYLNTSQASYIVLKDKALGVSYQLTNSIGGTGDYFSFCSYVSGSYTCAETPNTIGQWVHLVGIYDGTNRYLYVNGILKNTVAGGAIDYTSPNPLYIGGYSTANFGVDGKVDEVRIYNRALSATEVTNLYKSGGVKIKKAPTLVQSATCYLGGNTCTINITNTAGNLLWVGINDYSIVADGYVYSVSDTKGNTYNTVSPATDTGNSNGPQLIQTFYAVNIPAGANTITCSRGSHNGGSGRCVVLEYSGLATVSPLNGHAERSAISGTSYTTGSLTTTNANDLLIGYFASRVAQTWTNLSWTSRFANNTDFGVLVQDKLVSAKGQYTATATASDSNLGVGAINAFKSANGAITMNASQNNKLTNGLVGLWSFNGADINWGTNTAYDRSGQGNNGTLTNMSTTTSPAAGKLGQALRFNANGYISISPALNSTNTYTTSVWVKINGTTPDGYHCILSQDYNNNILCYGDSEKKFLFYAYGNTIYTDATYPIGKWYHVSIVHTPTTVYIYIDGVLAGTNGDINNSSLTYIGGADYSAEKLNGDLDEVRIYNRALSADEIKQLYLMGK